MVSFGRTGNWTDHTEFGNRLLDKARQVDPGSLMLFALPTNLPTSGERPPLTLRVGGNVQQKNLVKQPAPQYPAEAKQLGIQGTVRMSALIGLDGKIAALNVESGPPELVPTSVQTVRQWEYKPTSLNGKPVYVITTIDVNYTLN